MSHIEVINPLEKLSPELGGTGYQPPSVPATVEQLLADLSKARQTVGCIGIAVWKVLRTSRHVPRRLTLPNGRYLKCKVLGGTGRPPHYYWYYASVSIADGEAALSSTRPAEQ